MIIDYPTGELCIATPGLYQMTAAQYHADPCETPSLSSSLAKVILRRTPAHAFAAHPRYTEQEPEAGTPAMRLGAVVHRLLLGKGAEIAVIEADDWRTKAAQQARDAAVLVGKTPVLLKQFWAASMIAERAREGIAKISGAQDALTGGESELVAIWQEPNGAWCRAMLDHVSLRGDEAIVDDLKTTGDDIGAEDIGRKIASLDYHLSAAFYSRGLAALGYRTKAFRFLFVETEPPYCTLATILDGAAQETGRRQVKAAIHMWRACQATGEWPGHPLSIVRAELPAFVMASWEAREQNDPALADVDYGA